MPLAPIGMPRQLDSSEASPFDIGGSLSKAIAMRLQDAQTRMQNASAQEQEYKNPFVQRLQEADIGYKNAGARGLRGEAALKEREYTHPGSTMAGTFGDIQRQWLIENQLRSQNGMSPISLKDYIQPGQSQVGSGISQSTPLPPMPMNSQPNQKQESMFGQGQLPRKDDTAPPEYADIPNTGRVRLPPTPFVKPLSSLGENINQTLGQQSQQVLEEPLRQKINNQLTGQKNPQSFNPLAEMDRLRNAEIGEKEAMANWRNMGGAGGGVSSKELQQMSNQIQLENPEYTAEEVNDARSAYLEGRETLFNGKTLKPPSGAIQSMLETNYKRRSDVGQRAQERYTATLQEAISRSDENAKAATEYSGLLGKGEGSEEAAKSLLGGEASKRYQKFNNFVTVDVPTMAGEYMRQLGVNASDEQKRMYKEVVDPTRWYRSPQVALSQWNYFKSLAKDLGVTISKSAVSRHNALQKTSNSSADPLGIR